MIINCIRDVKNLIRTECDLDVFINSVLQPYVCKIIMINTCDNVLLMESENNRYVLRNVKHIFKSGDVFNICYYTVREDENDICLYRNLIEIKKH